MRGEPRIGMAEATPGAAGLILALEGGATGSGAGLGSWAEPLNFWLLLPGSTSQLPDPAPGSRSQSSVPLNRLVWFILSIFFL